MPEHVPNPNRYALDQEQIDSLLLDAETVSPTEKKKFGELVDVCHQKFLDRFGKFLENPIDTTAMKERFILTDAATNEDFEAIWGDKPGTVTHKYSNEEGIFRAFSHDGGFVIGIAADCWENTAEDDQAYLVKTLGGEEAAKKFINDAFHQNYILHEITHLYQPIEKSRDIPLWLFEVHAYWVGRELAAEESRLRVEKYDKLADFFQKLLDKYGDKVFELLYSVNRTHNGFAAMELRNEMPPELLREIFPDYQVIAPNQTSE